VPLDLSLPLRPLFAKDLQHPAAPSSLSATRLLSLAAQSAPEPPLPWPEDPHPAVERFLRFLHLQEPLVRWHYGWGNFAYPEQRTLRQLQRFLRQSRWFQEYLQYVLSHEEFAFPEETFVRTLSAIHTSAHFFEIPYPTLFCLYFQESRLDYKIVSPTGARGLGQLTSIGLKQIERLRRQPENAARLRAAVRHLSQRYTDDTWRSMLDALGYRSEKFPQQLQLPERVLVPTQVSSLRLRDVQARLLEARLPYATQTRIVRRMLRRVHYGGLLPQRYAPIHEHYVDALEEKYASKPGNVFHIETNVLLSALLFRHYLNYEWRYRGETYQVRPEVRRALAVGAYNQGQTGVRRFLIFLLQELRISAAELTLAQLQTALTQRRVQRALQRGAIKARELRYHIKIVSDCAEQPRAAAAGP
jgi:hypothetical protein